MSTQQQPTTHVSEEHKKAEQQQQPLKEKVSVTGGGEQAQGKEKLQPLEEVEPQKESLKLHGEKLDTEAGAAGGVGKEPRTQGRSIEITGGGESQAHKVTTESKKGGVGEGTQAHPIEIEEGEKEEGTKAKGGEKVHEKPLHHEQAPSTAGGAQIDPLHLLKEGKGEQPEAQPATLVTQKEQPIMKHDETDVTQGVQKHGHPVDYVPTDESQSFHDREKMAGLAAKKH